MASLYVVRGRDQGKHFQLDSAVVRIGRDSANQIQLLDSEASRQHAEIRSQSKTESSSGEPGPAEYWLIDLSSSNGTTVNQERIESQQLHSGDRIEIGGTLLIFTGTVHPNAIEAAHGVDIVQQASDDASRIVSSLDALRFTAAAGSSPSSTRALPLANQPPSADQNADRSSVLPKRPMASRAQSSTSPASASQSSGTPAGSASLPGASEASSVERSPIGQGPHASSAPDVANLSSIDADRSLEVMYRTAMAVGRTDDLNELLDRILQLVFDWVEADRGCIMLLDQESKQLRPAARRDRPHTDRAAAHQQAATEPHSAQAPISISSTILDYVLEHGEGVRTTDATDDVRFDAAASIVQNGIREALCVPLQGRYDIVGTLYIDTYTSPGEIVRSGSTQRFTDQHLSLITAIGYQAALAIEDTFYYSALLQSERLAAMGQTIATISHHVKNILQGITGGGYLIESGLKREDTDAIRRGWSMVDRNQERISNLVMDMLTFSKERQPQLETANLNETVIDVVELMATRAAEHAIELVFHPDHDLPSACFDPHAVHQAILNLVTNAIDAVKDHLDQIELETTDGIESSDHDEPVGGLVEVRTRFAADQGWFIDVTDNGPGIAPEDREKVFSLFESGKGARGTGLGLPVTAKIANEHGGRVDILSPESGKGCCFRFILPPADDQPPPENTITLSDY